MLTQHVFHQTNSQEAPTHAAKVQNQLLFYFPPAIWLHFSNLLYSSVLCTLPMPKYFYHIKLYLYKSWNVFVAQVRIDIRKKDVIKEGDTAFGIKVRAKVVKNKTFPPLR